MDSNQVYKQFLNEAKKSPKKAGLLALLFCAAVYVWGPLVVGLFTGDGRKTPNYTSVKAVSDKPSGSGKKSGKTKFDWKPVAEEMDADEWMTPAGDDHPPHLAQVFEASGHVQAEQIKEAEEAQQRAAAETQAEQVQQLIQTTLTPDQAGLSLTSTVVGGNTRLALISGKVYGEGAIIEVGYDDGFLVKSVEPSRVLLQRGDDEFELIIPQRP